MIPRSAFRVPRSVERRYLAVDGGSGAHLLAALAGLDPHLRPVSSPRHADLLIVVGPVTRKLAPAVAEVARALPQPAGALLIGEPEPAPQLGAHLARLEELFPDAHRVTQASVEAVRNAALDAVDRSTLVVADEPSVEPATIPLPPRQERELATELVVLSLGPIQPFTAGPLRLLLVGDGEQVVSVQVEAGYTHRGIAQAMIQAKWRAAAALARRLDPLAPLTCQLAYVRALEQLQGYQPPAGMVQQREAALAVERAQNYLWWLVHFARVLVVPALTDRTHQLATALAGLTLWHRPPDARPAPQRSADAPDRAAVAALTKIADRVDALGEQVEGDRLLALRTRGIGVLAAEQLKAAGVSGPVLAASERGAGDVRSRLLTRLYAAAADLRRAADALATAPPNSEHPASWAVPAGEVRVAVDGPRGRLGLHLASGGGDGPAHVAWQRPSAALLALIPELLAGQKLADAELTLASLDLAMAEADG